MKKVIVLALLSLTLGGCTGLEALLIGGIVGGLQNAYLKPLVDRYATIQPGSPSPTTATPAPTAAPAKP